MLFGAILKGRIGDVFDELCDLVRRELREPDPWAPSPLPYEQPEPWQVHFGQPFSCHEFIESCHRLDVKALSGRREVLHVLHEPCDGFLGQIAAGDFSGLQAVFAHCCPEDVGGVRIRARCVRTARELDAVKEVDQGLFDGWHSIIIRSPAEMSRC